jgi:hypothetical protein
MVTQCRLRVDHIGVQKDANGATISESLSFSAPYDDSPINKAWSKWTPSAQLTMSVTNPSVFGRFTVGQIVYVDIFPE